MAIAVPRTDSLGVNMTPMIDIVFQLILFFLFNLRFKTLDWRIESSLPKNAGPLDVPVVDLTPHLRVTLARLDADDPARARTRAKLGGFEWILPSQRPEDLPAREKMLAEIQREIVRLRPGPEVPGEIDVPPPRGAAVPHGDAVSILDAFLAAGVKQVHLQGDAMPRVRR